MSSPYHQYLTVVLPVQCFLAPLNECNYTVTEQECLAVIFDSSKRSRAPVRNVFKHNAGDINFITEDKIKASGFTLPCSRCSNSAPILLPTKSCEYAQESSSEMRAINAI